MTRTRRVMRGLGVSYVSQLLLALVGLSVTRFLLGRLGQEQLGLWLVATQLLAYLALTDLGIVALLPREVAAATGRAAAASAQSDLPIVIGCTLRIVFWQLPLVTLVALGFWIFLPTEWEPLRNTLAIVLAAYLLTFPLRVPPATLSGLQDHAFLGALHALATIAGAATTVVFVMTRPGLVGLAAGWTVTQLTLGGIGWLRLRARFPEALPRHLPHLTAAALRERFGRSAWILVSQVAVVLLNATDTVIIGKVLGAAAVVPYACSGRLIQFLANQPQLLMLTTQPGLAELRASESPVRILRAASAITQAVLLASGAIACGVVVVNYGFVQLWVGEAQWGGLRLTLLILLRTLLAHWNLATGSAIFAFGYERRLALVGIADGILFVLVTTLLVGRLGVIGAPLAGILTAALLQLPLNLSALARETETTVPSLVITLLPWAWRFTIAFGFAVVLAAVWRPAKVGELLVAGALAIAVYALLMVRRFQEPPLSHYLHPWVLALLLKLPRGLRVPAP